MVGSSTGKSMKIEFMRNESDSQKWNRNLQCTVVLGKPSFGNSLVAAVDIGCRIALLTEDFSIPFVYHGLKDRNQSWLASDKTNMLLELMYRNRGT